jgi:hypothetical protein
MSHCRLTETVFHGLRTLFLENALVKVGVLVDKGTDIFQLTHKPTNTDFMWTSRLGVRDPRSFTPTISTQLGTFLDSYEGGWQDLFPNADKPCVYKGADIGLHGEICLMPWEYTVLENTDNEIAVRFMVSTYRTPFQIQKTMKLRQDCPQLEIEETIRNESREEMDFMWGQHPALGSNFLDENCAISLPRCQVRSDAFLGSDMSRIAPDQDVQWPFIKDKAGNTIDLRKIPSRNVKCNDRVYIYNFEESWYAVTNKARRVGFAMQWEKPVFPFLLYWQSFGGWSGYPFYGTAYTMSLEPRSSFPFPLTRVIEEKTQIKLPAEASITTTYKAVAYQSDEETVRLTPAGDIVGV